MINLNNKDTIVIDVETSGINPFENELLAIGMAPINTELPSKLVYVYCDEIEWSDYAKDNFTKFASEWDELAVPPAIACGQIETYIRDIFGGRTATPIGHNIGFDVAFLRKLAFLGGRQQLSGLSHRSIDTHTLLYLLAEQNKIPEWAKSSDGAFKHFDIHINEEDRHTALSDAHATRELLIKVLDLF